MEKNESIDKVQKSKKAFLNYNCDEEDDPKKLFIYENININRMLATEEFVSSISFNKNSETAFISFSCINEDITAKNHNHRGWKFHLAINDSDEENMARAWNAVKDVLINHRIIQSKVVRKGENLHDTDKNQHGKQIIIYAFYQPDKDWLQIIKDITVVLLKEKIKPAPISKSDYTIPGSNYVSYRYDAPGKEPKNPFRDFVINEDSLVSELNLQEEKTTNTNISFKF